MNINWSTVFFQIINFLIVVWILKKYLFKPVLNSMDIREKTIQDRLKDAEDAKIDAMHEKERLESKIHSLEKAKTDIMAESYRKADNEYSVLMKTFNAEITGKRKAFEEQMIVEREMLRNSIRDLADKSIVETISNALSDLANAKIEDQILYNFIEKLDNGKLKNQDELKKYCKKDNPITVNTSFEISKENKKNIEDKFKKLTGEKSLNINFKIDEDIVCGIEILCPPLLISYGVNTYIDEMKKNLDDGLAKLTNTEKTVAENK